MPHASQNDVAEPAGRHSSSMFSCFAPDLPGAVASASAAAASRAARLAVFASSSATVVNWAWPSTAGCCGSNLWVSAGVSIWGGSPAHPVTTTSPLLSLIFIKPSLDASFIHLASFFHSLRPMTTSSRFAAGMYAGREGRMWAE